MSESLVNDRAEQVNCWRIPVPGRKTPLMPNRRSVAAWAGLGLFWLMTGLAAWDMWSRTRGSGPTPGWTLNALVGASVVVAFLAIAAGTKRGHSTLAAAVVVVLARPTIRGMVSDQTVFAASLSFGLGAAAIALAAVHTPPGWLRTSLLMVTMIVAVSALIGGINGLSGQDGGTLYDLNNRTLLGLEQLRGLAGHPNTLGAILAMGLTFQVQAVRNVWRRLPLWLVALLLVIGPGVTLAALAWSQSRGGQAAALVGLIVVAIPSSGRRGKLWAWMTLIVVAILAFLPWLLSVTAGSTFNGRFVAWQIGWHEFSEHPLFGYGSDLFRPSPYWSTHPGSIWEPVHAHSEFLQVAGTLGLVGLVALAFLVVLSMVIAVKSRKVDSRWALGAVSVLFVISALEVSLGVANILATYLPMLFGVAVLAGSLRLMEDCSRNPVEEQEQLVSKNELDRRPIRKRKIGAGIAAALAIGLILGSCSAGDGSSSGSTDSYPAGKPGGESAGPKARTANAEFVVTAPDLGIHSFHDKPQVPSGSIRMACTPTWAESNPAKGQFDWTEFDRRLDQVESWGFKDIMYVFCGTPQWAAEDQKESKDSVLGAFAASPPANLNYWDTFVAAVAERYKGRITSYEIWNEPSSQQFWTGTPKKMANMTGRAFNTIRQIDPDATIALAGTQTHKENYYNRFFPKYLKSLDTLDWPFDVVSAHFYPPDTAGPAKRLEQIEMVQTELTDAGVPANRPLWDTEVNYYVSLPDNSDPAGRVTGNRAAAWTVVTFMDGWRTGVRRSYWYVWATAYDNFPGIQMRPGDPSTKALNTFGDWVVGSKFLGCESVNSAERCDFEDENGEPFAIAWTSSGKATLPANNASEICPVYGGSCKALHGSIEVSRMPSRIK
jgi:hypothetical protein